MTTSKIGGGLVLVGIGVLVASVVAVIAGAPLTSQAPNGQLIANTAVNFALVAGIGLFGLGAVVLAGDDGALPPSRARTGIRAVGIGSIVLALCVLGATQLAGPNVDFLIVPLFIAFWVVAIGAFVAGIALLGSRGTPRRVGQLLLGGIGLVIVSFPLDAIPTLRTFAAGAGGLALLGAAIAVGLLPWLGAREQPTVDAAAAP